MGFLLFLGWLCSLVFLVPLMGIICYGNMVLAGLEADNLNAYDAVSGLNKLVFPEFYLQGALCMNFLLTGHWLVCLLALPNLYYNIRTYMQREHLVQVFDIFNQLQREKQKRWYKIIYLVNLFMVSTAGLLWHFPELIED